MASVADFQARFPEYEEVLEPRIQLFLDDAALLMKSPQKWGSFYDVALLYFAAHLLAVGEHTEAGDVTAMGPVKQQEVDDVLIVSAVRDVEPSASEFLSTAYGKRYLYYRKIMFSGPIGI